MVVGDPGKKPIMTFLQSRFNGVFQKKRYHTVSEETLAVGFKGMELKGLLPDVRDKRVDFIKYAKDVLDHIIGTVISYGAIKNLWSPLENVH